ncbi:MAG: hypothetical protein RLZZ15_830, partial [Verrucomicrobiota bacterium]
MNPADPNPKKNPPPSPTTVPLTSAPPTDVPPMIDAAPAPAPEIEPALEARLVAWLAGEASPFEVAELERLVATQPELALFKQRLAHTHALLAEAARPDREPLRMSEERRGKLLATLRGEAEPLPLAERIAQLPKIPSPWSWRAPRIYFTLSGAAVAGLALFLGVQFSRKPLYQASGTLQFEKPETIVRNSQVIDASVSGDYDVNTYVQMLNSRKLRQRVIESLQRDAKDAEEDSTKPGTPEEKAARRMAQRQAEQTGEKAATGANLASAAKAGAEAANSSPFANRVDFGSQSAPVPDRAVYSWKEFGSAAQPTNSADQLHFSLPGAPSSVLDLVSANATSSTRLNGQLASNGNVWVVSPEGVVTGSTAQINVGGFYASSIPDALAKATFSQGSLERGGTVAQIDSKSVSSNSTAGGTAGRGFTPFADTPTLAFGGADSAEGNSPVGPALAAAPSRDGRDSRDGTPASGGGGSPSIPRAVRVEDESRLDPVVVEIVSRRRALGEKRTPTQPLPVDAANSQGVALGSDVQVTAGGFYATTVDNAPIAATIGQTSVADKDQRRAKTESDSKPVASLATGATPTFTPFGEAPASAPPSTPSVVGALPVGPALAAAPSRDGRDSRDGTPASGGPTTDQATSTANRSPTVGENEVVTLSFFQVSSSPTARSAAKKTPTPAPLAKAEAAPAAPAKSAPPPPASRLPSSPPAALPSTETLPTTGAALAPPDAPRPRPAPAPLPPPANETSAAREPASTFSLHVADVSFRLAAAALARGEAPDPARIRPEEFYNAFDYGDPAPSPAEKVSARIEQSAHPFLQQRNLLRIAVKVGATGRGAGTPLRLTVLLDTSGSMEREDRAATVRRALAVLVSLLGPQDRITLVGFARTPRLLAENLPGDQARSLLNILARTPAEGGTNLEAALALGGELARRHRAPAAQNRLVLLTDGAANLGNSVPAQLAAAVTALRRDGIAFDACGVGLDGLDDEILESLTRSGDGRYYALNTPADADTGFAHKLAGAFRPAAADVKLQVRFNPARVGAYR